VQDEKGQFHLVMKPPYKEKNRKRKSALVLKGQFHLVMKPPYKEKNRKRKSALVLT
jgi:hypothetical protein